MALSPISFITPNFRDYKNNWLKAYEPGTTTPKTMALDDAGAVTVVKLELNADGFLESAGGALVIPYIDGAYDLWLFPTEAEADANDTTNAERLADDITGVSSATVSEGLINDLSQSYTFPTVAAYKTFETAFPVGKNIHLQDRKANFLVVTGTGSANTFNIIDSNQVSQSIDLIYEGEANAISWGAYTDGATSNTALFIYLMGLLQDTTISAVYLPKGDYFFDRDSGLETCLRWIAPPPVKFQAEPTSLYIYGDGTESRIVIDNTVGTTTWMAGPPADNVPDVFVEKLSFISKSIYDSDVDRETYRNNYITMPTYGRAFNCGRMWRATLQRNHFEYVLPFYNSSTDVDSPNVFCQQLKILNNNSAQHQEQAIDFSQCFSCDIIGNNFESGNRGIKVAQSNFDAGFGLRILRNTIQANGLLYSGIRINHGTSIEIDGNYFESNRTSTGVASVHIFMNNNALRTGITIKNNFFSQKAAELDGFGAPYYNIVLNNIESVFMSENNTFSGGNGYLLNTVDSIMSTDNFETRGSIYTEGDLVVSGIPQSGVKLPWTPVISDEFTGGNIGTATSIDAEYCINGKTVTLYLKLIDIDTTGMTAGNTLHIQGLPVVASVDTSSIGGVVLENIAFTGFVSAYAQTGKETIQLRQSRTGGSDLSLTVAALTSGTADILATITYLID